MWRFEVDCRRLAPSPSSRSFTPVGYDYILTVAICAFIRVGPGEGDVSGIPNHVFGRVNHGHCQLAYLVQVTAIANAARCGCRSRSWSGVGDGVGVGVGDGRSGPSTETVALSGNTITSFGSSEKCKRPNSLVTPKSKSFVTSGSAGGPKATGDATSLTFFGLTAPICFTLAVTVEFNTAARDVGAWTGLILEPTIKVNRSAGWRTNRRERAAIERNKAVYSPLSSIDDSQVGERELRSFSWHYLLLHDASDNEAVFPFPWGLRPHIQTRSCHRVCLENRMCHPVRRL